MDRFKFANFVAPAYYILEEANERHFDNVDSRQTQFQTILTALAKEIRFVALKLPTSGTAASKGKKSKAGLFVREFGTKLIITVFTDSQIEKRIVLYLPQLNGESLLIGATTMLEGFQTVTEQTLQHARPGRYELGQKLPGLLRTNCQTPCIIWRHTFDASPGMFSEIYGQEEVIKRTEEYYIGRGILTREECDQLWHKIKYNPDDEERVREQPLMSFVAHYYTQKPRLISSLTTAEAKVEVPTMSALPRKSDPLIDKNVQVYQVCPFESIFTDEEEAILNKICGTPPQPSLIPSLLQKYSPMVQQKCVRQENIVRIAAFVHNVYVYIHPTVDTNGRTARLLANYLLISHGMQPIVRTTDYIKAITMDMKNTKHRDVLDNLTIVTDEMEKFIYYWQISRICNHCGKSGATLRCSQCHLQAYCNKDCQTRDWADYHRGFCSDNKEQFHLLVSLRDRHLSAYEHLPEKMLQVSVTRTSHTFSGKTSLKNFIDEYPPSTTDKYRWLIVQSNAAPWPKPEISKDLEKRMLQECVEVMKNNKAEECHTEEKSLKLLKIAEKYGYTAGKWILFLPNQDVDKVWSVLSALVLYSDIITCAKVSCIVEAREYELEHVVCLYTENFAKRDQVDKAGQSIIRALSGILSSAQLHYKPDIFTRLGIYKDDPGKMQEYIDHCGF